MKIKKKSYVKVKKKAIDGEGGENQNDYLQGNGKGVMKEIVLVI